MNRLIVNSPYEEPLKHLRYERKSRLFDLVEGRLPAGCVVEPGTRGWLSTLDWHDIKR